MKKILIAVFLICIIPVSVACIHNTVNSTIESTYSQASETLITTETTYVISASRDAAHFGSETEMINQLKTNSVINDDNKVEKLDYYFKLKSLPEGTTLKHIRLKAFYLAIDYITDNKEPDKTTNVLTFVWYRTLSGDDLKNSDIHAGLPWVPMAKNENYSFYTCENPGRNESGKLDESLPKIKVCQVIEWTQDGFCFRVNAPLWFTEDDAVKYCIAEKVMID